MSDLAGATTARAAEKKRPYYRPTTADQRKLLFRVYEETGSVGAAVARAHVGKSTFYYWRKRFEAGGEEALAVVGSHAPHHYPQQLPARIVDEVKAAKGAHPDWGRQRIADELKKAHGWQAVVSPSEVRRILIEAGLWTKVAERPKRGSGVRHAEAPDQTVNVDLCFVPVSHAAAEAVPAVSGSAGRLIVWAPKLADTAGDFPGGVFQQEGLSYSEAMDQFIAARAAVQGEPPPTAAVGEPGKREQRAVRRALKADEHRLRVERGKERERRRLTDRAWAARRQEQRAARASLDRPAEARGRERGRRQAAFQAPYWTEWDERHRELARRREADARWREERKRLRERKQAAGIDQLLTWVAILVIVDNCTRRGLGLPLFAMGARVTAELVVAALKALLPPGLQYLISDSGSQFTAAVLDDLAKARGFVRVPLAKHRAQSNGIAERFIETLKAWLADQAWQTPQELQPFLADFLVYYNDRPHQGRELAGLSPNEYTTRLAAARSAAA